MWFKVDDGFFSHQKTMAVSMGAIGLWTMAGTWSAQSGTDGFVPTQVVLRLSIGQPGLADELVGAGLWIAVDGGFQFHDWTDYQYTAEEVDGLRWKRKEAGRRGGEAKAREQEKLASAKQTSSKNVASATASAKQVSSKCHSKNLASAKQTSSKSLANLYPEPEPDPFATYVAKEKNQKKINTSSPDGDSADPFDHFYATYPRKTGRQAAIKAWHKALKTGADPPTIIAGAQRYADECRAHEREKRFIKHPATWLNAGCWDDEPEPAPRRSHQPYRNPEDQSVYYEEIL